ncbi:RNA polymerase sigma factor [Brucellaceae bacterium D45D]
MTYEGENIASLYATEQRRLERLLIRKGMSAQGAADAVQEAFIRLLRTPRDDIRDIRSYLRRTTETVAIDLYRRERRIAGAIDFQVEVDERIVDPLPLSDAQMISQEELDALEAALLALPPRCREVLMLHKFEGLSYAQIAEHLGIAKNTIMVHMVKALGCLKSSFGENNSRDR